MAANASTKGLSAAVIGPSHGDSRRRNVIPDVNLGLFRVPSRQTSVLVKGPHTKTLLQTGSLGFAGAADADRMRWINSFRHMLDGLDGPMQVLIEAVPGSGTESSAQASPIDFDEMRGADVAFVDQVAQSPSSHRFETALITSEAQAKRLELVLREIDVPFDVSAPNIQTCFGKELANRFQHPRGHSRTWYVERLPAPALEPVCLFRPTPPGLNVRLAWHVNPLPVAWIVEYLQRQLINMRATRPINHDAGSPDPLLAGALPNAEDLQRRLAPTPAKPSPVP